jgi:hypothetical protein
MRKQAFERLQAMMASSRRMAAWTAVLALFVTVPAAAQENLDQGKSPAQIYASDCAICHKTPQGLSKAGGMFGLQGFLREHYTASKESAAAIAAYLVAVDRKAPPPKRTSKRTGKPRDKSKEKPKTGAAKPAKDKGETKGTEPKSAEPKLAEPKPAKPAEAKPAAAKPVEAKADTKSDTKSGAKSEAAKPTAKPAAQAKPETEKKPD